MTFEDAIHEVRFDVAEPPVSRVPVVGSLCSNFLWFDLVFHYYVPRALFPYFPRFSTHILGTSPRWGRLMPGRTA